MSRSSRVEPAAAPPPSERSVTIDGVYNFRDLGGGRTIEGRAVRSGRVYRSASLDSVTGQGIRVLQEIGVRTVVDLRSQSELDRHGRFPFEETTVRWVHVPSTVGPPTGSHGPPPEMLDHPDPMRLIYRQIVSEGAPMLGQALRLLANEGHQPVVFHCTSGKDRTGLLAMLVNLIIGVSIEDALTDFEHSALELSTVQSAMRSRYPELASLPPEVVDRMAGVDRSWVLEALTEVDALNDPGPWLDSIGVDAQVRDTIRRHLVH